MANRTVKDAQSIKGTNPQYLVEKIIRSRIYDSRYWKEECFALTAELLVDKAMELKFIGGVFGGNIKPTPFLCLVLKMLQIQPEKDIIVEFIKNEDFKYVRALGAVYMRLVGTALDCYKYLEPLYNDYRKLKRQKRDGQYELIHLDEFIDELLREERICDIILPRLQKRLVLEENNILEPRVSALDDDLDDVDESEEEDDEADVKDVVVKPTQASPERQRNYRDLDRSRRSPSPSFRRSRSPPRKRRSKSPLLPMPARRRSRDRDRDRDRNRDRDRERNRHRDSGMPLSRVHDRRRRSRSNSPRQATSSGHRTQFRDNRGTGRRERHHPRRGD